MKGFRNYAYLAFGLVAAVAILTLAGTHIGNAKEYPQQSHVIVDNNPSVNILNWPTDPIPVRDADEAVRQPIQRQLYFTLLNGIGYKDEEFTIPEGYRLVIEFVSGGFFPDSGQFPSFRFKTQVGEETVTHYLVPFLVGDDGYTARYFASTPVRVYGDAGTTVTFTLSRSIVTGTATGMMSFSGYLVPVSSP